MGSTRGGVKASAQRAHARWQQNEGFNNHIDLLPPWLAWCTPAQACALAKISTLLSVEYTCVHDYKRRCCCCHGHLVPSLPVYPHQTFFFKFKFLFKEKKTTPHQTHTTICAKKKNPHRFFSNTHGTHQGCALVLKWYFDRQCNTYFTNTKQIFI